jgi:hypothetical protein
MPHNCIHIITNVYVILQHESPKQMLYLFRINSSREVLQIIILQLNAQQLFTSPYHPECNRPTKHMILHSQENALHTFIKHCP